MAKIIAKVEITTAKDGKSTTFHPGKEYSVSAAQLDGLVKDVHYTEVVESKESADTGKAGKVADTGKAGKVGTGTEGGSDEV